MSDSRLFCTALGMTESKVAFNFEKVFSEIEYFFRISACDDGMWKVVVVVVVVPVPVAGGGKAMGGNLSIVFRLTVVLVVVSWFVV